MSKRGRCSRAAGSKWHFKLPTARTSSSHRGITAHDPSSSTPPPSPPLYDAIADSRERRHQGCTLRFLSADDRSRRKAAAGRILFFVVVFFFFLLLLPPLPLAPITMSTRVRFDIRFPARSRVFRSRWTLGGMLLSRARE